MCISHDKKDDEECCRTGVLVSENRNGVLFEHVQGDNFEIFLDG